MINGLIVYSLDCKHGISGKKCNFRHPKPCKKFMTHGDEATHGCSNGRKCEFLHPRICRTSLNKYQCFNKNSKYMHIKGTKWQRLNNENATPTMPKGTGNLTFAVIEKINQYLQQPQKSQLVRLFLEILQQIMIPRTAQGRITPQAVQYQNAPAIGTFYVTPPSHGCNILKPIHPRTNQR